MSAYFDRTARRKRALPARAHRNTRRPMTTARATTAPARPLVPVLAVVGVGLIGGSFAAALRAAGAGGKVLGVGRSAASLAKARKLGIIDEATTLACAAHEADLIFLATPEIGKAHV